MHTTVCKAKESKNVENWLKYFINYFLPFYIPARHLPFRVGVDFDNNELDSIVTADMTTVTEQNGSPGGIIGFKLTYFQVSC